MEMLVAVHPDRVPQQGRSSATAGHSILLAVCGSALALQVCTHIRYGYIGDVGQADGILYYAHALSWYFDGDCDYENNLREAPRFDVRAHYLSQRGAAGRVRNIFPCGWSMAVLPFLTLADGMTLVHNAVQDIPLPRDGYSIYYRLVVPLGPMVVGLAGLLAAWAVAAPVLGALWAALAMLAVWSGTDVAYFLSMDSTSSHATAMGFAGLLIWMTDRTRRFGWSYRRAAALGLFAGMLVAVRHQDAAWLAVPVCMLARPVWRNHSNLRSSVGHVSLAVLVFVLCLLPQAVVNMAIDGVVWGANVELAARWGAPRPLYELLESQRGLLVMYPVAAMGLAGLVVAAIRRGPMRPLAVALLIGFGAALLINGTAQSAAARRYVSAAPALLIGMAALMRWVMVRRGIAAVFALLLAGLCLTNVYRFYRVDRGVIPRTRVYMGFLSVGSKLTQS